MLYQNLRLDIKTVILAILNYLLTTSPYHAYTFTLIPIYIIQYYKLNRPFQFHQ